jgi:Leucine-rich repeat (LRR) protein
VSFIEISARTFLHWFCFRLLDISFNRLPKIENLDTLVNLEKLFLCCNKIPVIENLSSLANLTMLELGDNKIRVKSAISLSFHFHQTILAGNQRPGRVDESDSSLPGQEQNHKNPELGQANKPRVP